MPYAGNAARRRFELQVAEYIARIGERIRARREELGLSQGDLARELPGKSDGNQVSRWERGEHKPHSDTLEAIARVLRVDMGYLLMPEPEKATTPDPFADGTQFDRIERKLDAIIAHFGIAVTAPAEAPEDLVAKGLGGLPAARAAQPAPSAGTASKGRRGRVS